MIRKFKLYQLLSFLVLGSFLFFSACTEEDLIIPPPTAGFTFSIDEETGGIVTFTNTSQNADTYQWDFGDGTFSTLKDPRKVFMKDGTYEVSLVATNEGGSTEVKETLTIELIVIITDEDPPVISLVGEPAIELEIGEEFTDPGATANDEVDGDISANIVVTGEVNTFQPGEYVLAYNVTDAAGNAAEEVTRTVKVNYDEGLLVNGDFEDGTTGWIGNGLEVREEGGNSFSFTNVTTAGNPFDVNISQVLPIRSGSKYKLSFNASTDVEDGRTILAGIGLNQDPWTNVTQEFTLTTDVQRFSAEFTANFDSDNSRVIFDMGADIGVVVLDNISLELLSQNTTALPINFENGEVQTTAFNGVAFEVVSDPTNSGNQVGKLTNSGKEWEGMYFSLATPVDFNNGKIISMRFNSPVAGVPVLMKFESGTADPVEVAVTASETGWQDLTFDFDFATASYSQLTLFVDGPGTTAGEFYIDDITQSDSSSGGSGGCEGAPVAATGFPVTFETCESFISTFFAEGSLTTELAPNPSQSGINTSNNSLKVVKAAGTNRWAGFQNAFADNFDVSQTLKLKVYSSKADVVIRFELNSEPQEAGSGNPPPQFRTVAEANSWVEVEVNFTDIPSSNTGLNQLVIKPDNPDGTDGTLTSSTETYYFDDIRWEGNGRGTGGTGEAFFIDEFNTESALDKWTRLANAENNENAPIAYSADGGVGGTGAILLTLNDTEGGAYIFRYTNDAVDYQGNTNIRISYDAKVVTPITGSALHMQTQVPNPEGGVKTTNLFDTQILINANTFTTVVQDIESIDPEGTLFIIDFNFATGGGGAGAVLIDNVRIEKL
ncbi:DUF5011 domain-containing protein [Algoriphagus kandeliae]|uniref:DUF5011 domain-containing protein n=1 Tax=Algoriphagus kandeliae TaxID=2562278 RepID=A0A4Y9R0Q0_9BACT|nr:immunoglobulin-like domain-containing protein [Algoriphagus kandeliae]TFV97678.1 DUF5011 domain-containing protein [Algoriphagus kandeliae]